MNHVELLLSIIIVSYNVRELLIDCLSSIYDTIKNIPFEVIVVDNASSDGTPEAIRKKFPQCKLIGNKKNQGFAYANNQGFSEAKGEIILLLNPDTRVLPNAVETMYQFLKENPQAGAVTCRILYPNGKLQKSISRFPTISENLLLTFYLHGIFLSHWKRKIYYQTRPFEIDVPLGACIMLRKSVLGQDTLFNPLFFIYAEEVDLAFRFRKKGYKIFFLPNAEIFHYSEQSTKQNKIPLFLELQKSKLLLYKLHYSGPKAWLLGLTLWLALFSRWLTAILFSPIFGKERIQLFQAGVFHFSTLWKETGELLSKIQ